MSNLSIPADPIPLPADPNQNAVDNDDNNNNNGGAQLATRAKSRRRKVPVSRWLPEDWMVEDRLRSSGATAGTMDRYYIEPVTYRRFRSRFEVIYYLETGELKNKRMK